MSLACFWPQTWPGSNITLKKLMLTKLLTDHTHQPHTNEWLTKKKKKWPGDQIKKMWDNNSHQGGFIHSDQEQVKEKSFKIHFATT